MKEETCTNWDCPNCEVVDYGILDGYVVGETLLEGVRFQCRLQDGSWDVRVDPRDSEYFSQLNQEKWLGQVHDHCEDYEPGYSHWSCPSCGIEIEPLTEES